MKRQKKWSDSFSGISQHLINYNSIKWASKTSETKFNSKFCVIGTKIDLKLFQNSVVNWWYCKEKILQPEITHLREENVQTIDFLHFWKWCTCNNFDGNLIILLWMFKNFENHSLKLWGRLNWEECSTLETELHSFIRFFEKIFCK